jgi:predicted unusual protein kinase regulating ubiquinone biosynthesis (AarF/ABC1/UbiB family)
MEVKALQDLANKTMSRFPFRLPKNLALYMRMASILEGIYKHHNVKFEFVRVMANLLEEEGLLKEAYFEEVKKSITKFFKNLEMSTELAPMIKEYIQSQEQRRSSGRTYRLVLPASILSSAIIIGSALIYPSAHFFGYLGFAISGIVILGSLIYNKFRGQPT